MSRSEQHKTPFRSDDAGEPEDRGVNRTPDPREASAIDSQVRMRSNRHAENDYFPRLSERASAVMNFVVKIPSMRVAVRVTPH